MIPVFEPDGQYLISISSEYAEKALARGEIVRTEDDYLVLVPQPMNELDEATKRRIRLRNERKAR